MDEWLAQLQETDGQSKQQDVIILIRICMQSHSSSLLVHRYRVAGYIRKELMMRVGQDRTRVRSCIFGICDCNLMVDLKICFLRLETIYVNELEVDRRGSDEEYLKQSMGGWMNVWGDMDQLMFGSYCNYPQYSNKRNIIIC